MSKVYHGSCLCRSIKYEITGEPRGFGVCYCVNCRKFSGSSLMNNAGFAPEQVVITHGSDLVKNYRDAETKSGNVLVRWFCPNCGSSLFVSNDENKFRIVTLGTLDDEVDWLPTMELFTECRRDWIVGIKLAPAKL